MIDRADRNDADDDGDLEPDPSTVEDCLRQWRQALSGAGGDSVLGIGEWAAELSVDRPQMRARWIESIQRLRTTGEMDLDLSYRLIDDIVECQCDQSDVFSDPGLAAIHERMETLERAHGLEERGVFDNDPNAPAEWIALQNEWDAREEERRRELLHAAGEGEMLRLRADDPVDYWLRLDAVSRRLKREHSAVVRRNWNDDVDGPFFDNA